MNSRLPSSRFSHGFIRYQPPNVFGPCRWPTSRGGDGLIVTVPETPLPYRYKVRSEQEKVHGKYVVVGTAEGFWRVHYDGVVIDESGAVVGITAAEARLLQRREHKTHERRVRCAVRLAEDILGRPLVGREFRQIRDTNNSMADEVEEIAGSITSAQRSSIESIQ